MKQAIPFVIVIMATIACSKIKKNQAEEHPLVTSKIDSFHHEFPPTDTIAIYHYLDTIAYRIKDSTQAIQLAHKDATKGAYFFMEFGLIKFPEMDETIHTKLVADQKKLCARYNIWIFSMGCEDSETGRIYTREMKRLLKQQKGIDFDSTFSPAVVTL
jgi:hypothetical protein